MSYSKPIQILSITGNQYEVITGEIFRILDKIGNQNVAIVSINGNKRTGKSFLLNYFLRYLKYNKSHGNQWINGVNEETLDGFHWRGGAERDTVGIWMWSEPYIVKDKYGNDIVLLFLDTQGNFDEQTTFQECSIIFSLSLLMSSTLILNIKNDLSEDQFQFVEFFTTFAESFSGESQSNGALFQKLVFLVRDWENYEDYPFGYHDQNTPVSKNYMRAVITPNPNQCLEAQYTRKEILRYFNQVSNYLMPHPGREVSKSTFRGQIELMESDFVEHIASFVPIMLDSNNIEPKTIGGQILTGNILKQYLINWAEVIRTQKIPEAKSLTAATSEINYKLASNHALTLYNTNMNACIESKPTDQQLCSYHETATQKSLHYFTKEPKTRISDERKAQMVDDLIERMEDVFVITRKLNAAILEQRRMQFEMEKKNRENRKSIADLQNKISDVQKESKRKQAEQEQRFKEESDRLRQNIDHQNAEHRKILTDLETSHAQQRENFLQRNKDVIQQQLKEEHRRLVEQSTREMEERLEAQRPQTERERENANILGLQINISDVRIDSKIFDVNESKRKPAELHFMEEISRMQQNMDLNAEKSKLITDMEPTDEMDKRVVINNYRNNFIEICPLGVGAFSTVFKSISKNDNIVYAIKKISFVLETKENISKELKFLAQLESDYVVKYIQSWIEPNYYADKDASDSLDKTNNLNNPLFSPLRPHLLHIQMELCPFTLKEAINKLKQDFANKSSDITLSVLAYVISSEMLFEILECVQYLHSQTPAIIHRDLKPENILLTYSVNNRRIVKLCDFGLSTLHEFADQSHTKYQGTLFYKAPELNFTTKYTTAVDIYSLGIIILELFHIDINGKTIQSLLPLMSIKTIALSALNVTPDFRPNCSDLLSQLNNWRLSRIQLSSPYELNHEIIFKNLATLSISDDLFKQLANNKLFNNRVSNDSSDFITNLFKSFFNDLEKHS